MGGDVFIFFPAPTLSAARVSPDPRFPLWRCPWVQYPGEGKARRGTVGAPLASSACEGAGAARTRRTRLPGFVGAHWRLGPRRAGFWSLSSLPSQHNLVPTPSTSVTSIFHILRGARETVLFPKHFWSATTPWGGRPLSLAHQESTALVLSATRGQCLNVAVCP